MRVVSAGIRNQIFLPMARNKDGHYELDGSFVSGNEQVKCDAEFTSRVYDKVQCKIFDIKTLQRHALFQYDDYVKGKVMDSTTGFGIEVSPRVTTSIEVKQGQIK